MDKIKKKLDFELIGVGKTLYNSSCAYFNGTDLEVLITERYNKKKYSGEWPWRVLEFFIDSQETAELAECRDVMTSLKFEFALEKHSPFSEYIKSKNLSTFLSSNKSSSLTHHYAHALCGLTFSDGEDSIVCVIDGAGTDSDNFSDLICLDGESNFVPEHKSYEGVSFYKIESGKLICLSKKFYKFYKSPEANRVISNSPGMLFEYVSEVIFNSKHDAGKVMGLSAFGTASDYISVEDFLKEIEWDKSFSGNSKEDWERSIHIEYYKNLAASAQKLFEKIILNEVNNYSEECSSLIFVGGAAMNCVNNMKLSSKTNFKKVLVPPCPGDDGISIGLVQYLHKKNQKRFFFEKLPYLGKDHNHITNDQIHKVFNGYKVEYLGESIVEYTANEIHKGKVLGWFQGRSEIGARALGNRSIIARVDKKGLKSYLNEKIKFRESFRPYACSCLEEYADTYFEVGAEFESPYMSFAVPIREEWRGAFKEVLHVDGTSRAQFVSSEINDKFYRLISSVGKKTGLYSVLNTSLNVMGQPIVETLEDLLVFFDTSNVDGVVIGDYFVTK